MHPRRLALVVAALVTLAPAVAAADVLPPPTLVLDSLHFGAPGVAVMAILCAAAVLTFRALRRRGRGRAAALAVAVLVFVIGDLAAYAVAISVGATRGERPLPDRPIDHDAP